MKDVLVIIGAGGHAVSVTNVALSCGMSVLAYVDDSKAGGKVMEIPVISKQQCLQDFPTHNYAIAIGDNAVREKVLSEYKKDCPQAKFPALIHKSSALGMASSIGDGTIIMPLVNIGPNAIVGSFCVLNTGSIPWAALCNLVTHHGVTELDLGDDDDGITDKLDIIESLLSDI